MHTPWNILHGKKIIISFLLAYGLYPPYIQEIWRNYIWLINKKNRTTGIKTEQMSSKSSWKSKYQQVPALSWWLYLGTELGPRAMEAEVEREQYGLRSLHFISSETYKSLCRKTLPIYFITWELCRYPVWKQSRLALGPWHPTVNTNTSKHFSLSGIRTTTTLGMGRDDKKLVNRARGLQLKKFMNHWLTD